MNRDQKIREYFIERHRTYEHTLKGEFFDKISNLIAALQDFLQKHNLQDGYCGMKLRNPKEDQFYQIDLNLYSGFVDKTEEEIDKEIQEYESRTELDKKIKQIALHTGLKENEVKSVLELAQEN